MPTRVNLRAGTKVLISGHPATLCIDGEFEFDLPTAQAVGESLMNDTDNFALNRHLIDDQPANFGAGKVRLDDAGNVVVKEDQPKVVEDQATCKDTDGAIFTQPIKKDNAAPKKPVKNKPAKKATKKPKAASKPVVVKAKMKAKKGKKR
jgi:hypothetical protein